MFGRAAAPAEAAERNDVATASVSAPVPKGWGAQEAKAAPFFWSWPRSKKYAVFFGTLDTSFTSWGMDLPHRYRATGATVKAYLLEVGLLAALLLTMTTTFLLDPPHPNENGLVYKLYDANATDDAAFAMMVLDETYHALWAVCSYLFFITVLLCVLESVVVSMNPEACSPYLLVRLGKVQKMPLQFFVIALVGGALGVVVYCLIAFHWIAMIVVVSTCGVLLLVIITFFVFPIVGALLDTIEAERAGELQALVQQRIDAAGGGSATARQSLSPDLRHRTKAVKKEEERRASTRRKSAEEERLSA